MPLPDKSMASKTQFGDVQRLITSVRFSSKKEPLTETLSLHFIEASPGTLRGLLVNKGATTLHPNSIKL
jgi:hypothetical protein